MPLQIGNTKLNGKIFNTHSLFHECSFCSKCSAPPIAGLRPSSRINFHFSVVRWKVVKVANSTKMNCVASSSNRAELKLLSTRHKKDFSSKLFYVSFQYLSIFGPGTWLWSSFLSSAAVVNACNLSFCLYTNFTNGLFAPFKDYMTSGCVSICTILFCESGCMATHRHGKVAPVLSKSGLKSVPKSRMTMYNCD